ncbi:MAG: hypothetical protein CMM86_11755 [Rhodovulum sp.]|nr:hypothetical protein [Rhodovulum sp.]|tara:strand:+ start:3737 stop:4300 length:564 start_codon:yes stop_codon:yes gene_type:complete
MRDFEFKAGSLCLDLVDTVSERGVGDVDLLATEADVARWVTGTGRLAYAAGAVGDIASVRNLREAIFNAASACIDGALMDDADLAVINAAASVGAPRPVLMRDGVVMRADDPFAAMMAEIAGDAIALLGGERRARLRRCGGCNMLFFDASPPGRRKWCSSAAGCGNQAKTRNRRARIAAKKQGKAPQ